MTTKTELQQNIEDAILENKEADDKEIARIVFSKMHPGEEYKKGCSPSEQYVAKRRGRISYESQAPEIEVTGDQIPEPPTIEAETEAEIPFQIPPTEEKPPETAEPSLFNGKQIVKVSFDGIAAFAGWEGWKLDPKDEVDSQFIEASDRMITKYGPGFIEKWGDEVMFVISAGTTIGPRIRDYKKHLDEQKPKPEKAPGTVDPTPELNTTPAETKIAPSDTPLDDGPRSVGDDAFKKRVGGQLR